MSGLQFSHRQQAMIAAAVTFLCGTTVAALVLALFFVLGRLLAYFSGVFVPLAVAGILALMLRPLYEAIRRRLRWPLLSAVAVLLCILVPVGLLLWFFGSMLLGQLAGVLEKVPAWWDRLYALVQERLPALREYWAEQRLGERFRQLLELHSREIAGAIGTVGAGVFRVLTGWLNWLVTPVYVLFFLIGAPLRRESVEAALPFLKPETRKDVIYLADEFVGILVAFFRGQVLVAVAQGVCYATGFALIGLQYGIVIGLLLGLLNIIPYLGAIVGVLVALPTAFFQDTGGLSRVLLAGTVICAVQALEGYVLTPKIIGRKTGLHPMVIMVAMFFWGTALGGIVGMILAVPLTAFLVVLWRLAKAKYIREIV
jgi:predicted PurR-regulated permease PerM